MAYKRSNLPNVYRDKRTNIYYIRTKLRGRTVWKSLGTSEYAVAKMRSAKALADVQKGRLASYAVGKGIATFGQIAELYRQRIENDPSLKPSSKVYRLQCVAVILRFRPQWADKPIREIRDGDCQTWAHEYVSTTHPARYNTTIGTLRQIFGIAIDNGLLAENPARKIAKARVTAKQVNLPSVEQFAQLVETIESSGAPCANDAADLVRFLAFSGCRINEAINIKHDNVDLGDGTILILGDPIQGTKSGSSRTIPRY